MQPHSGPIHSRRPGDLACLFWKIAKAHPRELVIPGALVLLSTLFDGLTFGLLLPISRIFTSDDGVGALAGLPGFGALVDAINLPGKEEAVLVALLLALIGMARIAFLATEYVRKVYVNRRNERYYRRGSAEAFGRILGFGRSYFDRRTLGEIETELGWMNTAPQALSLVEATAQRSVRFCVMLGLMLATSVPLTIVVLLLLPMVLLPLRKIERYASDLSRRAAGVERTLRSRALDVLSVINMVKVMSAERKAMKSYEIDIEEAEELAARKERITGLRWPLAEMSILGPLLAVQIATVLIVDDYQLGQLAAFAIFLVLLQQTLPHVDHITGGWMSLSQMRPKLEAVADLFDEHGKGTVPSGPREFSGIRDSISVRNLDFEYSADAPVLRGVSAEIPAMMTTAIVGTSGSGKTTLLDLILRLYDVPAKRMLVDGVDIREFSLPSFHERIAVVGQESWLLHRSLRENLVFGLDRPPSDESILDVLRELGLDPLLAGMPEGLDTLLGDRGVRLSGGERQRVGIARALLREPDVLILDEATSALDSVSESLVLRAVRERSPGRTLIVVAHRLSTVRDADHIIVVEAGRVVEAGGWQELLDRRGAFWTLYSAQKRTIGAGTSG